MEFETLQVEPTGAVLRVTLNRPALRNAMSLRMVAELRAVLADAESNVAVRVLLLRGAGGHFCAGADLKDMAAASMRAMQAGDGDGAVDAIAQANQQFGELCVAYAKTPLAIVAVLEGTLPGKA